MQTAIGVNMTFIALIVLIVIVTMLGYAFARSSTTGRVIIASLASVGLLLVFFVGVTSLRPQPAVITPAPITVQPTTVINEAERANFQSHTTTITKQTSVTFTIIPILLAIIVVSLLGYGIVRAPQMGRIAIVFSIVVVGGIMTFWLYWSKNVSYEMHSQVQSAPSALAAPPAQAVAPSVLPAPPPPKVTVEAEPKSFEPSTTSDKPSEPATEQPASATDPTWLTQSLQRDANGWSIVVTSDLFPSVNECERDLEQKIPQKIQAELQRSNPIIDGSQPWIYPANNFTRERHTKSHTTSQGTWYTVAARVYVTKDLELSQRMIYQEALDSHRVYLLAYIGTGLVTSMAIAYLLLRSKVLTAVVTPAVTSNV
jgi:hypothetical protein